MSANWFEATGIFGWVIICLTVLLVLAGVVGAAVRVPRGAAIALLVGCQLPLFAGLVGMMIGRARAEEVVHSLKAPTPGDLAVGYDEASRCLFLGIAAMLVCDAAAVAALVRARKPGTGAAV